MRLLDIVRPLNSVNTTVVRHHSFGTGHTPSFYDNGVAFAPVLNPDDGKSSEHIGTGVSSSAGKYNTARISQTCRLSIVSVSIASNH